MNTDPDTAPTDRNRPSVIGLTEADLRLFCREHGFKEFHGSQVFHWVYVLGGKRFDEMTDVPASLRETLAASFVISPLTLKEQVESKNHDAVKYRFSLSDGLSIESVALQNAGTRPSFCISSQVGCPVGCLFCATAGMGLLRNLTSSEIVAQVVELSRLHTRPRSILYMGMGEPLLNMENLTASLRLFEEIDLSCKRITVSTCGVVPGIIHLADSGERPRLAVSLGSADEERRKTLIPLAARWPLERLGTAIAYYREKTKRRVSIEYTLIRGINDSKEDAVALARFAGRFFCHVNLIRYNRVDAYDYKPPDTKTTERFKSLLLEKKITVSERYRKGADIQAACGQLVTQKSG
ncbi:MAG: 23S rRNA (adenine(2503)-C(2))-methyltransferase RlmN [Spirochaetes bacterium]|nr:23S rRNA (adenine(2503)-C(2))-methyltransferase RlmN [Spirochaetota bacterium]